MSTPTERMDYRRTATAFDTFCVHVPVSLATEFREFVNASSPTGTIAAHVRMALRVYLDSRKLDRKRGD